MNRTTIVAVTLAAIVGFSAAGAAAPGNSAAHANSGGTPVRIPDTATAVAPGVYHLGQADNDPSVEGYMFVRYKKGYHHRPGHAGGPGGGKGGGDSGTSDCYSYIFDKHTQWKADEPWVMNPANDEGLDGATVVANQTADLAKWEEPAAAGMEVFGSGTQTSASLSAETSGGPDGTNEVYFGAVESEGAIAVTIVWARTRGPPAQREILEWDQVYDQADFDWSLTGEAGKMDFDNIATHEDGHAAGMGHTDCTEQTMYGYATTGETKKRTLETGDETGAGNLYS